MTKAKWAIGILIVAALLAGCGGSKSARTSGDEGAQTSGVEIDGTGGGSEVIGAGGKPSVMRIYFAFDSATIDTNSRETLESHAAYLRDNPDIKIRIEGHCDERGTREYNLALGERRAQAVKRMLGALGVRTNQMATVSYGEEKPLAPGHDNAAWKQNRRAELVY